MKKIDSIRSQTIPHINNSTNVKCDSIMESFYNDGL